MHSLRGVDSQNRCPVAPVWKEVRSSKKKVNRDGRIVHARGRKRICGNALRGSILQLSGASEDGPGGHGHSMLPRDGSADGDVISRVRTRTRFGTFTAESVGEDGPVQINKVVHATLRITEQDDGHASLVHKWVRSGRAPRGRRVYLHRYEWLS